MSSQRTGATRNDTDLNLQRLEDFLLKQTEDGPFRFKAKFIASDIESSAKQLGYLLNELEKDNDGLLEFDRLTNSSPTTWEVRRKTVCVECGHDHAGYDTIVDGASHCYSCGFPKQRRRRNDE